MIAIRWMQALICLRHDAKFKARQYLKLCVPAMLSIRQVADELMSEKQRSADDDQGLLDFYHANPDQVIFKWSTMNMDDMGMGGESYREYNKRVFDGKLAMMKPDTMQGYIDKDRKEESTQRRLVRALDFFIEFSNKTD